MEELKEDIIKSKKANKYLIPALGIILVIGAGYFVFKNQYRRFYFRGAQVLGMRQNPNFGNLPDGAQRITGKIIAIDGDKLTLQSQGRNGSSTLTVMLTDSTQFNGGKKEDLKIGNNIGGFGSENGGTISALQIMVNPQIRRNGIRN